MRRCVECGESKPEAAFNKRSCRKDGLSTRCKPCVQIRAHRYYQANVEHCRAWRRAHPEYSRRHRQRHLEAKRAYGRAYWAARREEKNAYDKAYRIANLDKVRERKRFFQKRYRLANPDKVTAINKAWRARNPERRRMAGRKAAHVRRARLHGLPYESVDLNALYVRDGGRCHICHRRVGRSTLSFDHLVPVVDGGGFLALNLAAAHLNCNRRRHTGQKIPAQLLLV